MSDDKGRLRGVTALLVAMVTMLSACSAGAQVASGQASSASSLTASTSPSATPTAAVTTGIVQGGDGWSTYTDSTYGFSIRFPTKIFAPSGAPCTKGQPAVPGVVPATTMSSAPDNPPNVFYVTQKYAYLPIVGCRKNEVYKSYLEMVASSFPVAAMTFSIEPEATRSDVVKWLHKDSGYCGGRSKVSFKSSKKGVWVNVTCATSPTSSTPPPSEIRWYPDQGLLAQFTFHYLATVENVAHKDVEQQIANSFGPPLS